AHSSSLYHAAPGQTATGPKGSQAPPIDEAQTATPSPWSALARAARPESDLRSSPQGILAMLPEVHRWLGIALGTAVWLSQASTAVAGPAERFRPAASPGSHIATETSQ